MVTVFCVLVVYGVAKGPDTTEAAELIESNPWMIAKLRVEKKPTVTQNIHWELASVSWGLMIWKRGCGIGEHSFSSWHWKQLLMRSFKQQNLKIIIEVLCKKLPKFVRIWWSGILLRSPWKGVWVVESCYRLQQEQRKAFVVRGWLLTFCSSFRSLEFVLKVAWIDDPDKLLFFHLALKILLLSVIIAMTKWTLSFWPSVCTSSPHTLSVSFLHSFCFYWNVVDAQYYVSFSVPHSDLTFEYIMEQSL